MRVPRRSSHKELIGPTARVVGVAATVTLLLLGKAATAGAAVVGVTAPSVAGSTVAPSATVWLTGAAVSDSAGDGDQVLVTVSADSGVVSFYVTSGLTLATGYHSFTNVGTVAFQGTVTSVNAALASMTYTAPAQATSDRVSITATSLADAGGNQIAYDPATGHFYEYVADSDVSWFTAQTDQNKLPNLAGAVRWMPAGVIKVVLMLAIGKASASLLYDHVSNKAAFVDLGFVLLGIPSLLLGLFGFFAREGETFSLNWAYRFGGAGLVAFGFLVAQGIVPIK